MLKKFDIPNYDGVIDNLINIDRIIYQIYPVKEIGCTPYSQLSKGDSPN